MDWETLFLFVGAYILLVGIFYHHWIMGMRLIEVQESNTKILERIEDITAAMTEKRVVTKHEDTMKKMIRRGMELEGRK